MIRIDIVRMILVTYVTAYQALMCSHHLWRERKWALGIRMSFLGYTHKWLDLCPKQDFFPPPVLRNLALVNFLPHQDLGSLFSDIENRVSCIKKTNEWENVRDYNRNKTFERQVHLLSPGLLQQRKAATHGPRANSQQRHHSALWN